MPASFHVGVSRDFLTAEGTIGLGDIGLGLLDDAAGIEWSFLAEDRHELVPADIASFDALAVLGPHITADTLVDSDRLAVIARYGVGYDTIDIESCTAHGIAVTITPDGVRRPMATAILTQILALSGRLLEKDRLTRAGAWNRKLDYMGTGLTGRTLGTIGLGNIGREIFRLAAPFEMRSIAFDPYTDPEGAPGIELVGIETLFREADFLVVCCALTPETRHLVNAERLALMKRSAYLISSARGPIVDQAALTKTLRDGRIAGAALDVFEREPVDPNDPILALDNVIVTPHALGWTNEWILLTGRSALGSILEVAAGRVPGNIVNRQVVETPRFRERLAVYATGSER